MLNCMVLELTDPELSYLSRHSAGLRAVSATNEHSVLAAPHDDFS